MKLLCRIIFSLIAIGCSQPEKNDAEAVQALVRGIIEADNRGDIKTVMSFYHPEAILFPPGRLKMEGLAAIEKNYVDIFASSKLYIEITINETRVANDWALVVGRNGGYRTGIVDNVRTEIDDPFMMVLEKYKGEWKIKQLLWN